jgi:hypothetical protein
MIAIVVVAGMVWVRFMVPVIVSLAKGQNAEVIPSGKGR